MAITKKKVEKVDVSSQAKLFDLLEKSYDAYFIPDKYRTDILPLDEVLGGYLESGSLIELSGESGAGKSTLLLHLVKNLAEQGLRSVYIDAEGSVKSSMIDGVGLTPYLATKSKKDNLFTLIRESGYERVEELISSFLKAGGYKVFIIDSLSALTGDIYLDLAEDRNSTEGRVGFDAQMNSRLLKKLNALKTKHNCIFIVVNQTRVDLSNPYRATYSSSGGQAVKFYPDIRLFMKVTDKLKDKRNLLIGDDIESVIGANCTIEARKSRLGAGFIPYPLTLYFGKGVSNLAAYITMLPSLKNDKGKKVYEEVTKMTIKLHLNSGDYQTTKGKTGLNVLIVEHGEEINEMCYKYVDDYFNSLKNNLVSSNYDDRDDLIVEENKVKDYSLEDVTNLEDTDSDEYDAA